MDFFGAAYFGDPALSVDHGFTNQGGNIVNWPIAKDFRLVMPANTAVASRLVLSLRRQRKQQTADVILYSDTGLAKALNDSSPDSTRGTLTRDDAAQVTAYIYADVIQNIAPAAYWLDLTELTTDSPPKTTLRFTGRIMFTRVAGNALAPTS